MTQPQHSDDATTSPASEAVELAWVEHLVEGGTTPWRHWRTRAVEAGPGRSVPVPGAQNLEALRRLNQLNGGVATDAGFAEQVLTAALPGRGRPDLRLAGGTHTPWGHPPVEPDELRAKDLLRVVTGVIAERLLATELPPLPLPRRRRRWARPFELHGDPWARAQAVDALALDGRVPGGSAAHAVVLGAGLDDLLAAQWALRSHREPTTNWMAWTRSLQRHDRLPAAVDLAAIAAHAADRLGTPRRVHLVFEPAAVGPLVGMPALPAPAPVAGAVATDLTRHVGTALVVRTSPEVRHRLVWEVLRPLLARHDTSLLRLPERVQEWAAERAAGMTASLQRAGYRVHGDLARLVPTSPDDESRDQTGDHLETSLRLGLQVLQGWSHETPDNGA